MKIFNSYIIPQLLLMVVLIGYFIFILKIRLLGNGSNKIIFRDKLSGYMGNIKVLEEFDKYNKHYIENYLDNKNLNCIKF